MRSELLSLLQGRRGHFQMESGFHSDSWYELGGLFTKAERVHPFVVELAHRLAAHSPELVCGPATGGALLAEMIAPVLGVPWLPVERHEPAKPSGLFPVSYRVPRDQREQIGGLRTAIVDDAISAGSAVRGSLTDLQSCGAKPVAVAALIVFGETAAEFAQTQHLALETIATEPFALWHPAACPLCRAGRPLTVVSEASRSVG